MKIKKKQLKKLVQEEVKKQLNEEIDIDEAIRKIKNKNIVSMDYWNKNGRIEFRNVGSAKVKFERENLSINVGPNDTILNLGVVDNVETNRNYFVFNFENGNEISITTK